MLYWYTVMPAILLYKSMKIKFIRAHKIFAVGLASEFIMYKKTKYVNILLIPFTCVPECALSSHRMGVSMETNVTSLTMLANCNLFLISGKAHYV